MAKGDVETYHQGGQWRVRVQGDDRVLSTHDTRDEAVAAGRKLAMEAGVKHVIKNMDGTISEKNSYGHDPRNSPG